MKHSPALLLLALPAPAANGWGSRDLKAARTDVPLLRQRLMNMFPDFGGDMLKVSSMGEFAAARTHNGATSSDDPRKAVR